MGFAEKIDMSCFVLRLLHLGWEPFFSGTAGYKARMFRM
jgi:hypothetical protein